MAADEVQRLSLIAEHARQCVTATLADHNHDLALAALILAEPAIPAILFPVRRPNMAAEKCTVDFRLLALAADRRLANLGSHRFANFVRQDESGFVLRPEIAAEGQHRLALDLIREDRNRYQVGAQRHLVEGEQGAARDREIFAAGFAAPTGRTAGATGHIDRSAAAVWAIGVAAV